MPILAPKRHALQEQVDAKIQWNADEEDVIGWLGQRHSIRGAEADAMIAAAKRHRARVVRERSLYGMIVSGVTAIVAGAMSLGHWTGGVWLLRANFIMLVLCVFSGVWFTRYLVRFLTGRSTVAE